MKLVDWNTVWGALLAVVLLWVIYGIPLWVVTHFVIKYW